MNRRSMVLGGSAFCATLGSGFTGSAEGVPNLYVPPEEDPHELTFMQWPVNTRVHPDRVFLNYLQQTIADIANTIVSFEKTVVLAAREDWGRARKLLSKKVELWDIPTEDLWCRDSGPLFARTDDRKLAISHIQFNGWGAKQIYKRDGKIAKAIAERLGLPLVSSGLKGEAGGVEHDGHGLLMAHESSWVNNNRNPGLSRGQIEERLLKAYGARRMIWSPGVWGEDITDYHIDSLARFTAQGKALVNLPDKPDQSDPFHIAALQTHDALITAGIEVDVIPEPEIRRVQSDDFVASYANYYVCNGGVLAAQFGDHEADNIAVTALKRHYPDREIVTLNVDALGEIGGGIHCATQQMPAL